MKFIFLIIVISTLLTSCKKEVENNQITPMKYGEQQSFSKEEFTYQGSITIDSIQEIIIPLSFTQDSKGDYSSFRKGEGGSSYWNMIFYNTKSMERSLLTEDKIMINQYHLPEGNNSANYIFYEVIKYDYDKDTLLTYQDPVNLYFSDLHGKNFKRISPENEQLIEWKIIQGNKEILVTTAYDLNNDLKFDSKDQRQYYTYNLQTNQLIKIIDKSLNNHINNLFKKQWLK